MHHLGQKHHRAAMRRTVKHFGSVETAVREGAISHDEIAFAAKEARRNPSGGLSGRRGGAAVAAAASSSKSEPRKPHAARRPIARAVQSAAAKDYHKQRPLSKSTLTGSLTAMSGDG